MNHESDSYIVGVDVGGTFTDVLCIRCDGVIAGSCKVPSIPGRQWQGVLDGLRRLDIPLARIVFVVHGTTIATNSILERKGARTALLTTGGFRDVLEIGRTRRMVGGLFDFKFERPKPLAARSLRWEVRERIAADGDVLVQFNPQSIDEFVLLCQREQVEAVAIGFINSHVNSEHEREACKEVVRQLPDLFVCASSDVSAERGEFERFSTAVINAYVGPVVGRYLDSLMEALGGASVNTPVDIMGSHGGALTLEEARRSPVRTFLSGPVGGAIGAAAVAAAGGVNDFITFDMGGTSTDVGLFPSGHARISHDNRIDAYPLRVPQVDLHTIGAGGGSVASCASDGTLEVGPHSAGADPGPACYDRGGQRPTVSDANLMLGRLPADRLLGGTLKLSTGAARAALTALAAKLGTDDVLGLADGIIRVAVAKMAAAVREVTVHRGQDPSAFALLAFGGAGPMHAFLVADELGITRVVVPRWPGHLSAFGQLSANRRYDFLVHVRFQLSSLDVEALKEAANELERKGAAVLQEGTFPQARQATSLSADMRYVGQSFTLPVPISRERLSEKELRQAHSALHRETFGFHDQSGDVEIVALRLVALGLANPVNLRFDPVREGALEVTRTRLWFDGTWLEAPIYTRERLVTKDRMSGPALVEEAGATTVVPPGWTLSVDHVGNLMGTKNN